MPSFDDILGQERAVGVLRRALGSGRLHHAWIFHGPAGVGKRTTAEAFAALLLDPTAAPNLAGELQVDPGSAAQRLLSAGSHPDLHVVNKELAEFSRDDGTRRGKQRSIPIEVVREFLIEPATRSAGDGAAGARARRVFIVDEAHLMQGPSANAALKILEEPPAGVVFILITDDESALLPTIRSRCQRVAFTPLDGAAMRAWMQASGLQLDPAQEAWLLEFADGSPGRVATALETGLYEWAGVVEPMLAQFERGRSPEALGQTISSLVDAWAKAEVEKKDNASKDIANKAGADHMFNLLANWARRRLRAAAERGADTGPAAAAVDAIDDAQRRLETNVNMTLVFDGLAARLGS
ncbi:MAG: hypothetical protein IBJ10_08930 [Phycisphaerales bacterium]|nr:hypothetical protein [Phycisphaerales bacterium]